MRKTEDILRTIIRNNRDAVVTSVERLSGGFNCAIYRLVDSKRKSYIAKKYIVRKDDHADRLLVEFQSLTFLWRHDIRTIPEPVYRSSSNHLGVYRFVEGESLLRARYTYRNIIDAANFWRDIHKLKDLPAAKKLHIAKEACFTLVDYFTSVERRLVLLRSMPHREEFRKLHEFLEREFLPFYKQIRQFVTVVSKRVNIDAHEVLPRSYRTLSPSDFGFHNALRTKVGDLVFFDFEYFGWDDPAKTIADFFLHPKMALPYKLREYFYAQVIGMFDDASLSKRLPLVYMILSLKWCLIMLNEFTRERQSGNEIVFRRQLTKSRMQLNETIAEMKMRSFPLSLLT